MLRKNKKRIERIAVVLVALLALVGYYFYRGVWTEADPSNQIDKNSPMSMTVIDIGQGDSILLRCGDKNILIDAGPKDGQDKLIAFLKGKQIEKFDYVIATHPHADHIGGMSRVISEFPIDHFIMTELPDAVVPTTKVYEKMATALLDKNVDVIAANSGDSYQIGDLKLDILAPISFGYKNLNNFSVVAKVTYGDVRIMLCGDAEKKVEKELLESGLDLKCDIYKVAHHGSDTSSSKKFLEAMSPSYAVISAGNDNSYNHPNKDIVQRISDFGIKYYVTKEVGTVTFETDGVNINVVTEREKTK